MSAVTDLLRNLTSQAKAVPGESLEDVLADLQRYGKPRLGVYGKGWHAVVEVHVTAIGTSFDVRSEHELATPQAAALECRERLRAAIKQLGAAA